MQGTRDERGARDNRLYQTLNMECMRKCLCYQSHEGIVLVLLGFSFSSSRGNWRISSSNHHLSNSELSIKELSHPNSERQDAPPAMTPADILLPLLLMLPHAASMPWTRSSPVPQGTRLHKGDLMIDDSRLKWDSLLPNVSQDPISSPATPTPGPYWQTLHNMMWQ